MDMQTAIDHAKVLAKDTGRCAIAWPEINAAGQTEWNYGLESQKKCLVPPYVGVSDVITLAYTGA